VVVRAADARVAQSVGADGVDQGAEDRIDCAQLGFCHHEARWYAPVIASLGDAEKGRRPR
jgi:hypothetical protein